MWENFILTTLVIALHLDLNKTDYYQCLMDNMKFLQNRFGNKCILLKIAHQ